METSLCFDRCELDPSTYALRRDGRPVPLQPRAFDLLLYLIEHRERVVPRSELLDVVWGGAHVTPSALARTVYKARQALGDTREPRSIIATVHGRGFRFVAPLRAGDPAERTGGERRELRAGELERARLALELAVRVLGERDSVDPVLLAGLRSLARELCGLLDDPPDAVRGAAEEASERRTRPARGWERAGLRGVPTALAGGES